MTLKRRLNKRKSKTPKQAANSYPVGCKFWLPLNEGSGESFTEHVSGEKIISNVTSDYSTPHAIQTLCPKQTLTSHERKVTGNFIALAMAEVVDSGSGTGIASFGWSSQENGAIWMGYNRCHVADGTPVNDYFSIGNPATAGDASPTDTTTPGEVYLFCAVRDNNILTFYRGIAGGAITQLGDTADITSMKETITLDSTIELGGGVPAQIWYGSALLECSHIPDDITTRLERTAKDWLNGIKTLSHWNDT